MPKIGLRIQEIYSIAEARGGRCLSTQYLSSLQFECAKGHRWFASRYKIEKLNTWCPECSIKTKPKKIQSDAKSKPIPAKPRNEKKLRQVKIEAIWELAKSKGVICLSEEYVSASKKLQWQCDKGHNWWAMANSIKYRIKYLEVCCPICDEYKREKLPSTRKLSFMSEN